MVIAAEFTVLLRINGIIIFIASGNIVELKNDQRRPRKDLFVFLFGSVTSSSTTRIIIPQTGPKTILRAATHET